MGDSMAHSALVDTIHCPPPGSRIAERGSGALVMCASIPWHFHRNRQQELALRLSAFMPVIYVEPPTANGARPSPRSHSLRTVAKGCYLLPSPKGVPGDRVIALVNRFVQKRMARSVQAVLSTLGCQCSVLWIDRIESAALIERFPDAITVYDCADEEWSFGRFCRRSYLHKLEDSLLSRSDLAIASSSTLHRRLSERAPHVELVPNACDFEHFSRGADDAARPSDLPPCRSAIIGFIGGVTRRALDHALLRRLFRLLPGRRFVFVGTADAASAQMIAAERNAALLGAKDYADIPAYLAAFDVAIIPYCVGGRIDYVYPKKLHEYLAAGKPVVATDLPELRRFEGVVRIGRTPKEFARKILECLAENADPALSARLVAQRRAVAQANTWERRVEHIVTLLDTELRARGRPSISESRVNQHA